jgi:hypothetical protein
VIFGDHAQVKVTRDSIEVEEYNHDWRKENGAVWPKSPSHEEKAEYLHLGKNK